MFTKVTAYKVLSMGEESLLESTFRDITHPDGAEKTLEDSLELSDRWSLMETIIMFLLILSNKKQHLMMSYGLDCKRGAGRQYCVQTYVSLVTYMQKDIYFATLVLSNLCEDTLTRMIMSHRMKCNQRLSTMTGCYWFALPSLVP